MMFVRGFILGLDMDFVAPNATPLQNNDTNYDFVAMVPLAVTSTRGWQSRLGRSWRRLHRLAYLAAVAAVVHFVWLVKADVREPMAWAIGLAALFAVRLPPVRRRLAAAAARATRGGGSRGSGVVAHPVP